MLVALLSQESARRAGEAESAYGNDARHADLKDGHALRERFGAKVRAQKIVPGVEQSEGAATIAEGFWGRAGMSDTSCFA